MYKNFKKIFEFATFYNLDDNSEHSSISIFPESMLLL